MLCHWPTVMLGIVYVITLLCNWLAQWKTIKKLNLQHSYDADIIMSALTLLALCCIFSECLIVQEYFCWKQSALRIFQFVIMISEVRQYKSPAYLLTQIFHTISYEGDITYNSLSSLPSWQWSVKCWRCCRVCSVAIEGLFAHQVDTGAGFVQ